MSSKKNIVFDTRTSSLILGVMLFVAIFLMFLVGFNPFIAGQHFVELAYSFLHGRFDLMFSLISRGDVAVMGAQAYWPLGPFPAVMLMPLVAIFGMNMITGFLLVPIVFLIGAFIHKIAKRIGFTSHDSLWLVFAFIFVSPFVNAAWSPMSWQFAHVVVVFFMFLSILEYYGKKRYWLIGLFYAFILATRITAALTILFFVVDIIIVNRSHIKLLLRKLVVLGFPSAVMLALLLLYNYVRFGSLFEVGYSLANLGADLTHARSLGVFSLAHVPANIYYFLVASPVPIMNEDQVVLVPPFIQASWWGVGLIFSAPYYLSLVWKRYNDKLNKLMWASVILALIPLMMYFSTGPAQISYRYALDFLPFLFLIFLRSIYHHDKKLSSGFKIIITLAFMLTLHLFLGASF